MKAITQYNPLTNKEETLYLKRIIEVKDLVCRWEQELGISISSEFHNFTEIQQYVSLENGFEWFTPSQIAGTSQLYEQLEKFDWYYMPDKWEFKKSLDYLKEGQSLLEVGSGQGYFLEMAKETGFTNITGIELNSKSVMKAKGRNLSIFECDMKSLKDIFHPKITFDAICSFQVIEHISNPFTFLTDAVELLSESGTLILSVPNGNIMKVIDPDHLNLLNLPPHHMSIWNKKVFRSICDHFPLKLIDLIEEPLQSYHVNWFVYSIASTIRNNTNKFIGKALVNRISLKLVIFLMQSSLIRGFFPGHTLLAVFQKYS